MGHPSALSPEILNVWDSLGQTGSNYVLVGGTALAWRLGHRMSFDVDLVTSGPVDHPRVLRRPGHSMAVSVSAFQPSWRTPSGARWRSFGSTSKCIVNWKSSGG